MSSSSSAPVAAADATSPVAATESNASNSTPSLLSHSTTLTSRELPSDGGDSESDESGDDDDDSAEEITEGSVKLTALSVDKVIERIEQTPLQTRKNNLEPLAYAPQLGDVKKDTLAIQTQLAGKTPRIVVSGTAADLCAEKQIAVPGGTDISVRMYEIDKASPADAAKTVVKMNGKTQVRRHLYPTDKKKGPMRFITRAPDVLRTSPLPEKMRGDVVTGIYKFRLPLQDHTTQHEVGLLMKQFGALYLTIPQSESVKAHARMFDAALAPGELHSHIMTAEILRVRNDTNTSMRAVMEVPRFSLDEDASLFRPLISDGTDGSFSVPINYDGAVVDAYGNDDARIFDVQEKCKGLVGSPEYHRWCNVTNVGALLSEMRNTTRIEVDEHFAYYIVPLPINDIPDNLAQYMVIQHNIELYEATALIPPREVQNENANSAEARKKEKEWASELEKAIHARFSSRRKKLNAKKRAWKEAMKQFDALRVSIDEENKSRPADDQKEIPMNAPVFPVDDLSIADIEAELLATTHPRPVHTSFVHARAPELIKTELTFAVRVPVAAIEAMVYHMANLYNPEQTAVNKTLMRIKLVPEHPDDTNGKSFDVNHKRDVLQKRVSSACINVTVRTTEMVYTGSDRGSVCAGSQVQSTKAEVIAAAFKESQDYDSVARQLSDQAAADVYNWEKVARLAVLNKGTLREQASGFYEHAEADRLYMKPIHDSVGEAAKTQLLDARLKREQPIEANKTGRSRNVAASSVIDGFIHPGNGTSKSLASSRNSSQNDADTSVEEDFPVSLASDYYADDARDDMASSSDESEDMSDPDDSTSSASASNAAASDVKLRQLLATGGNTWRAQQPVNRH